MPSTENNDQTPNSDVRLAIVGLGLVGQRHADAIDRTHGAKLCAVVDPSETGIANATQRGVPCFDNLNEMIITEMPDGIVLSTPTKLHVAQGIACVDAGIPVLIEKPLADNLASARAFVAHAHNADVAVLVGHHRRHNPLIRKAHDFIQQGKLGTIRVVNATCWFYKPDSYFDAAPWRTKEGAGPISVNLVHDVDLMRHLCGEVVCVQAQAVPSARGFGNEDVAAALLTFKNGAIGTISVSDSVVAPWSWEMTSHEHPVYPATQQSAYQIGGSHGALSIPDLTLWTHEEHRDWWTPIAGTSVPTGTSDPLTNQMVHFAAVIRGEEQPLVSGHEGLRSLAVVDAIQTAARTQNTIQLTLDQSVTAKSETFGTSADPIETARTNSNRVL